MTAKNLNANLRVYEALSDSEIVNRIRAGDLPLFELIMRRYNRRLFRYARAILNDDGLAQDAVQEAYLSAFRYLDQFRGPDGFAAWLMRIASRSAMKIGRKESSMRLVGTAVDLDQLPTDESSGPEPTAINAEAVDAAERAIDRLPQDFRVVFMLRELEGMNTDETANVLGIKPATVKTRLHRAKSLLRGRIELPAEFLGSRVFAFAGARCDAIVERVFATLGAMHNNQR